jgi:hypothetical protein
MRRSVLFLATALGVSIWTPTQASLDPDLTPGPNDLTVSILEGLSVEDQDEVICLALNIYFEARGAPLLDQQAVAAVTLNRLDDERWANDVCGVVYQPYQFSWVLDRYSNLPHDVVSYYRSLDLATAYLHPTTGNAQLKIDPTRGANHYYNPARARPTWRNAFPITLRTASHVYLRAAPRPRVVPVEPEVVEALVADEPVVDLTLPAPAHYLPTMPGQHEDETILPP